MHLAGSNPAVHVFSIERLWSHHRFFVITFSVESVGKTDIESVDCDK